MPALRIGDRDQLGLAIEDLVAIARGHERLSIALDHDDLVRVDLGGGDGYATVMARAAVSLDHAVALVRDASTPLDHIVVADQISSEAKTYLGGLGGWGWLDRRTGELRVTNERTGRAFEVMVPADLTSKGGPPPGAGTTRPTDSPIRGRAGVAYAVALLLRDPDLPTTMRGVGDAVGMVPSSIHHAASGLRAAGLVQPNGEPALPDLFWALSAIWQPQRITPVATRPLPHDVDQRRAHLDDLAEIGWAQSGDEAAAAWGAPMLAVGDRPCILVPTQVDARRLERRLGVADWDRSEAIVVVPPTPLACVRRFDPPDRILDWPTPHPLFLALELAQDPTRGREILEGWTPPMFDIAPWAPR